MSLCSVGGGRGSLFSTHCQILIHCQLQSVWNSLTQLPFHGERGLHNATGFAAPH